MTALSTLNITTLPLNALKLSPQNVRKHAPSKKFIESLATSILADGVLQNLLVVSKDDGHEVIGGGCRLAALNLLLSQERITADYPVPVKIVEATETAVSLTENFQRQAMSPVDEFEAFNALIEHDGLTVKEVAHRFSVTLKYVKQRMKLASVAPALREACRAGDMTLDCLIAFTLCDDITRQEAVWNSVKQSRGFDSPHRIRALLSETSIKSNHALAKFVGQTAYKKAGGAISTDLFEDVTYFTDAVLLTQLAQAKLEKAVAKIKGMRWVRSDLEQDWEFVHQCGTPERQETEASKALQAELTDLETEIDQLQELDEPTEADETRWAEIEEQMEELYEKIDDAKTVLPQDLEWCGCYVYIDQNGKLHQKDGLILREDLKARSKTPTGKAPDNSETSAPIDQPAFSKALEEDLWCHRLTIAKHSLAHSFQTALDLMIYRLVVAHRQAHSWSEAKGLAIGLENTFSESSQKDVETSKVYQQWQGALHRALSVLPEEVTGVILFNAVQGLSRSEKHTLFAALISISLEKPYGNAGRELFADLEGALFVSIRDHWTPTRDNLFSRVKTPQLVTWGKAVGANGNDENWDKLNKKALATRLDRHFNVLDDLDEDERQARAAWLPECMA